MPNDNPQQFDLDPAEPLESAAEESARLAREDEMIEEGLADIEAGRLISHEAVRAWVDSWGTSNELPMPQPGQ